MVNNNEHAIKTFAIGESDFKKIITGNHYYIDKSLFIKDIIDRGELLLLIPRPRRFGKTLNISMLKYFYDCCPPRWEPSSSVNNKQLFESLAISKAGKEYTDKMGKYPVIFLSFRDMKEKTWELCYSKIKQLVQGEYLAHDYLLNSSLIKSAEKTYFKKIIELIGDIADYENSLEKLLIFLTRFYGERAVILIDEYDAPIHAGFTENYYDEIINFMRNFLSAGLKDTGQYLEKGIITGTLRIAKESIFSGLNNPGVFTLLSREFDDKFGFTENEVEKMLKDFNVFHLHEQVRSWYNGYKFGNNIIYNPWSIINFLARIGNETQPYWLNTSDNRLVETLLTKEGKELQEELEQLIRGEAVEKAIEEDIVLKDVGVRENLLWSFLLMGGYLRQSDGRRDESTGKLYYSLFIPNKEVRITYTGIIERYFTNKIENKKLEIMLNALIEGDVVLFEEMLQKVITAIYSYHDFGDEPEKVYHALVTGILTWITNTHEIKSNRESGYGRYDIMIIPQDTAKIGYVIEFKKTRKNETVESAVNSALQQLEAKKYETELVERGIKKIKKLAIVFSGKDVFVRDMKYKD